jgi:hypothetical protein
MKRRSLIFSLLLMAQSGLIAQRVVEISYVVDGQGRYVYSCNNKAFCPYVLHLDFSTMTNGSADHALPIETEVKPGVTKLITVSPIDKNADIKLTVKSSYRKGCINPVVNTNFTYLLPVGPGHETQAYRILNGPSNVTGAQDSGYSARLRASLGDTIYAARRGVVTEVNVSSSENDAGATATSGWNFIEIYHADCSFATYGVLKQDGAFVRPGQTVEAGTPLGLVGGDRYGRGSEVRFSVTYYPGVNNTAIPLQFWTKGNGKGQLRHGATYFSEFPKAIVNSEKPRSSARPPKKAA